MKIAKVFCLQKTKYYMFEHFFRPGASAIRCLLLGRVILQPFFGNCAAPESAVLLLAILWSSMT